MNQIEFVVYDQFRACIENNFFIPLSVFKSKDNPVSILDGLNTYVKNKYGFIDIDSTCTTFFVMPTNERSDNAAFAVHPLESDCVIFYDWTPSTAHIEIDESKLLTNSDELRVECEQFELHQEMYEKSISRRLKTKNGLNFYMPTYQDENPKFGVSLEDGYIGLPFKISKENFPNDSHAPKVDTCGVLTRPIRNNDENTDWYFKLSDTLSFEPPKEEGKLIYLPLAPNPWIPFVVSSAFKLQSENSLTK